MGATLCSPCVDGVPLLFSSAARSSSSTPGTSRSSKVSGGNILPNNSGQLPEDMYNIEKTAVGAGAFGTVRRVVSKKTGAVCALKTINKVAIPSLDSFRNEVSISACLDHPNIIRLYETFEDKQNVYLAMEICHGGEMFDKIIEQGHFNELDAARLFAQIMRAVLYMHKVCVAHRDLKPENFLLKEKGVELHQNTLKIIDFGIASRFTRNEGKAEGDLCLRTQAGTAYYVAPEVMGGRYNEKCDIWSAGVILYILLSGAPPFGGADDAAIMAAARAGRIFFDLPEFQGVSDEVKQLIRSMCSLNPRARPTAAEVLSRSWVQQPQAVLGQAGGASLASTGFIEKLRSLTSVNRFKKAALNVIAHRLDDKDITRLRDTFLRLDKDGDGTLTLSEIKAACQEAGLTCKEETEKLFAQLDFDGSGSIGYSEFLAAMIDQKNYLQQEVCWEAFRVFDRDGNGTISLQEFRLLLSEYSDISTQLSQKAGEAEIDALFKEADQDGNGLISFDEFMAMLQKST